MVEIVVGEGVKVGVVVERTKIVEIVVVIVVVVEAGLICAC